MALLVALTLAACGGQAQTPAAPQADATQAAQAPTATLAQPALQAIELATPAATSADSEQLPPVPSGCTVVTRQFSAEPTQQSLFPAVTDADWVIGEDTAAMTLVEYADFQCPSCATLAPVLAEFKITCRMCAWYSPFPAHRHPGSPSDKAAYPPRRRKLCHRRPRDARPALRSPGRRTSLTVDQFRPWLVESPGAGSGCSKLYSDLDSEAVVSLVQGAWDWGLQVGLPGTPFLLLNGKIWDMNVPLTYFNLSSVIKLTLLD
jgi:hypothetical protein